MYKKYNVTCLKCGDSDELTIEEDAHVVVLNRKVMLSNILSSRYRGDDEWGFQCRCGNDNRISAKEADKFDELVQGDPLTVERIRHSMKIADSSQFKMEAA